MQSPDRFVLHPSVAARWWLQHLPHATEANRLLFDVLATGGAEVAVVAGIEYAVLRWVATDPGEVQFDPDLARLLCEDILELFGTLISSSALTTSDRAVLVRVAFPIASYYAIDLDDAFTIALAQLQNPPLLLAEESVLRSLQPVAADQPRLRLLWLPNYLSDR
jgi:hypothetical protein